MTGSESTLNSYKYSSDFGSYQGQARLLPVQPRHRLHLSRHYFSQFRRRNHLAVLPKPQYIADQLARIVIRNLELDRARLQPLKPLLRMPLLGRDSVTSPRCVRLLD